MQRWMREDILNDNERRERSETEDDEIVGKE